MKLQTTFALLGVITSVFAITQAITNHQASTAARDALRTSNVIGAVIQRHMDGDMMHDAIRSDVLTATLAANNGDSATMDAAIKDLEEHTAAFYADFEQNQTMALPENLSATYKNSMDELAAYTASAKSLIVALQQGAPTAQLQEDFLAKFEAMEGSNEALTEQITAWNDREEQQASALLQRNLHISHVLSVLTVLAVVLVPLLSALQIFRPLRMQISAMGRLASNDFSVVIEGAQRRNEIGEIARAITVFKENGEARVALEREQEARRIAERAEEENRAARAAATQAFASRMQAIIENVAAAATEMYRTSEGMGYSISSASTRAGAIAQASNQTATNVQSVAAAAEELSATVREIAEQINRSNVTVREAVGQVSKADTTAASLQEATQKIGEIVNVIQAIAEQINLLALNATIESARAGEAGKGFAVVAGEVKNLATQTGKATAEIAGTIAAIQQVSTDVICSLQSIKDAIVRVEEISGAISAAAEEQNATTNEIASNMGTAADGSRRINEEIGRVSEATSESSDSAAQVLEAAKMLSQEAERLNREIQDFMQETAA